MSTENLPTPADDDPLQSAFVDDWKPHLLSPGERAMTPEAYAEFWRGTNALPRVLSESSESQLQAAERWALAWPHLDDRAARSLGRALSTWAICSANGVPNPLALARLVRHFCPEDVAVLEALGVPSLGALAVLRTASLPTSVASSDGLTAASEIRAPYPTDAPAVFRLLVRHHAARANEDDVARLADRLRATLLNTLDADGSIPAAFCDTAEPVAAWDRLDAAAAVSDNHKFLGMYVSENVRPGVDADDIARAIAVLPEAEAKSVAAHLGMSVSADSLADRGTSSDGTAPDSSASGSTTSDSTTPDSTACADDAHAHATVRDIVDALRQRVRLSDARDAVTAPYRPVLVQSTANKLAGLGWTWLVALSLRPNLAEEVQRLLDEDVDWFDFDAPGEGELPATWAAALGLSEALTDELADALDVDPVEEPAADSATNDGTAHTDAARWLASTTSPATARGARLDGLGSPMSSYAHGLNEAVAEAYGDVYSPADPFSTRPARSDRKEPSDER